MTQPNNKTSLLSWLHLFFGAVLVVSFFLPWASWKGSLVNGSAMATGDFFKTSVAVSGPDNPFPKLNFTFYIFWLIPAFGALAAILALLKKKTVPFSYMAGALSLALFTVYYLFSNTLTDFGVGKSAVSMLKPAAYIHVLAAIGLIFSSNAKTLLPKILWLLIGPVIAYAGYKIGEKQIMSETFGATKDVKADYTVNAADLIKEFMANDTATNKKYLDKVLAVNGNTSKVELLADSTSTISFADSTGSYAIFH